MQVIFLSGGSGKRLWPLGNDVRSKQFIKIFKDENGQYESMLQRVARLFRSVEPDADITVATDKRQVSAIQNQLGDGTVGISVEPGRKGTFPAVVLACSYLKDIVGISEEEIVVVCPIDPYVEEDYFRAVRKMADLVGKDIPLSARSSSSADLLLMGIEPGYPSDAYGYIIPSDKEEVSLVRNFKEKPSKEIAAEYIANGALWNGGVFAFRLGYLLRRAREHYSYTDYQDFYNKYSTLETQSFDHAIIENEPNAAVLRFGGKWKDIGSWETMTEAMTEPVMGMAILDASCKDLNVINELNVPVLCMGLKNVVVSASAEGILVSDKARSNDIRPYVDGIVQEVMFAEKSWGSYNVLDVQPGSMTIRVTLNAGHRMNYHSHERRNEVWTLLSGRGRTIVDGMEQQVKVGDVITIMAGCRHTIIADTDLSLIEVQLGENISIHDKKKFDLQ